MFAWCVFAPCFVFVDVVVALVALAVVAAIVIVIIVAVVCWFGLVRCVGSVRFGPFWFGWSVGWLASFGLVWFGCGVAFDVVLGLALDSGVCVGWVGVCVCGGVLLLQ